MPISRYRAPTVFRHGHNNSFHNTLCTKDPPPRIITRVRIPQPEDALNRSHTRSTQLGSPKLENHSRQPPLDIRLAQPRVSKLSSSRTQPNRFMPKQSTFYRPPVQSFNFHQFTNPLGINVMQVIDAPEGINYLYSPPEHTLKPKSSPCSPGQLENEYVEQERYRNLPP